MPSHSPKKVIPGKVHLRPTPPFIITLVLFLLFVHAVYVSHNIRSIRKSLYTAPQTTTTVHVPVPEVQDEDDNIPNLFIFRRSKKTGSTTMLDALQKVLLPKGYVTQYGNTEETKVVAHAENLRPNPRRLLIANHNQVTKSFEKNRNAIIADTIRDGYQQMTSFCRFFVGVKECDEKLISCLTSRTATGQNSYRWAYHKEEDTDTYIDLPLSAAHPGLSTTVLRSVFPNATIQINDYNVVNSTCPEIPELRRVYNEHYQRLDQQVKVLRKRMLTIAGYPVEKDPNIEANISLEDMLDAAESMENHKYDIKESTLTTKNTPKSQKKLMSSFRVWTKMDNDTIGLKPKFGGPR